MQLLTATKTAVSSSKYWQNYSIKETKCSNFTQSVKIILVNCHGRIFWEKIKSKRAKQLTKQSFTIEIATSSALNSPDVSDINRVSKGCQ